VEFGLKERDPGPFEGLGDVGGGTGANGGVGPELEKLSPAAICDFSNMPHSW
jgi:hypothetical protein